MTTFDVTSISPSFNATDVLLDTTVEATFNAAVLASSVTSLSFSFVKANTLTPIEGTVTLVGNNTVRYTPNDNLAGNTRYTAIVMGGPHGIISAGQQELISPTISWSFTTGLYEDSEDQEDSIPFGVDPTTQPTGDELYIVSSEPLDDSIGVLSPSLRIALTGPVPSDTAASIKAYHPLGYPMGDSYWQKYSQSVVSGDYIIITSSGDLSEDVAIRLVLYDDETEIEESSIVVASSGAISDGMIPCTFVTDPNFTYEVDVFIPTNRFTPEVSFLSEMVPQYAPVEELRLAMGPATGKFNDYTLSVLLYKISRIAKDIWTGNNHTWPSTVPYYAKEYVLARAQRDLVQIILRDPGGSGGASKALGDIRIQTRTDSDTLAEDLRQLDLLTNILAGKLARGDIGTRPISGPVWAEASKGGSYGTIGRYSEDYGPEDLYSRSGSNNFSRGIKEQKR